MKAKTIRIGADIFLEVEAKNEQDIISLGVWYNWNLNDTDTMTKAKKKYIIPAPHRMVVLGDSWNKEDK